MKNKRAFLKKALSLLMVAVMTVGIAPLSGFVGLDLFSTKAEAADNVQIFSNDNLVYGGNGTIKRIEWLHNLSVLFEMTVSSENVPDNYFADLTEDSEYYKDAMLATEFGVVDIEAGGNIDPEGVATREFTAHTLNFCLGFKLENADYTFSDVDEVTYDEDVQIALDRNWFSLVSGAFVPTQAVTDTEIATMIADAQAVLTETETEHGTKNIFEYTDNVTVVPNGTDVEIDDDGVIKITDCPVSVSVGDIFVVFVNGLPAIYTAYSVRTEGNVTTITGETYNGTDVIKDIKAIGAVDVDMSQVELEEDVKLVTEKVYSKSRKAANIEQKKFNKTVSLGDGASVTFDVVLNNMVIDYDIDFSGGYYKLNLKSDVMTTATANFDFIKAAGYPKSITLGKINVAGIGSIDLTVNFTLSGQVGFTNETYISVGAELNDSHFRAYKTFQKKYFTITAEIDASIYLDLSLNADILGVIKGSVGARAGVKGKLIYKKYYDEKKPEECTTLKAWMFAECYYYLNIIGKTYDDTETIYNEKNSPVRVYYHYEDGIEVTKCIRDGQGYYTPASSRYGSSGMRYGSSTGLDYAGEVYTIYTYDLDEDNNATITGYKGNASAIIIPEKIDGYTVKAIGSKAFSGKTSIYSVIIPKTLTEIGTYAFFGCTALREIVIPDTVTEIGTYAFADCKNLSSVSLSKSLISLDSRAFQNCTALTSIHIPKTLETVFDGGLDGPFAGCTNLKTVTFEENTTKIAGYLFHACPGIEEITIPNTVTEIGYGAFRNCKALKKVVIPNSVTKIGSNAFSSCTALKEIVIPDTVTEIGTYAFFSCTALKEISIPEKVTQINNNTFENCKSLSKVTLPKTLTEICDSAFKNCDSLTSIEIPEKVETIKSDVFRNCDALETVAISDSVKTISKYAFAECEKLKNVTLGKGITTIERALFMDCLAIEEIVIQKGVTEIKAEAFRNCTSLKKVTIPVTVTSIDATAFSYPDKTTIYGCTGTYAETFAKDYGFKFVDITNHITGLVLKDNENEQIVVTSGMYVTPEFEYMPADTTDIITLTSNNTSIVTVSDNQLYGRSNGTATVTATTSGGLQYTFNVYVHSLNSISVTTQPSKTKYNYGEELDLAGLVVTATFSDGLTETVDNYTVSGYDPETYGSQTVRIAYNGRSTTFKVEVIDNRVKLTSIAVTTLPNKTTYIKGEAFDPKGIVITAYYSDGTSASVNGYSISAMNSLKIGTQTLTVTYEGFTDTIIVIVNTEHTCSYSTFSYYQTAHPHYAVYKCECSAEKVTTETGKLDSCEICNPHVHTPKTVKVDATCTVNGMEYTICQTCGEQIGSTTVIPAGHKWGNWNVATSATLEKDGVEKRTCSACGKAEERVVSKLGETLKDKTTGTELVFPNGAYEDNVQLIIEEKFDGESFQIINTIKDVENSRVFDITTQINGLIVQPSTSVIVKILLPEGYDPKCTFIYHIDSITGKIENMKATHENGYMVFETTHFSIYSIVEVKAPELVSIEIETLPTNTTYTYKKDAGSDGLMVIAVYSDGSEVDVTENVNITNFDTTEKGDRTATVEFEGETATFNYTVSYAWWQWIIVIVLFGWIWY